MTLGEYAKMVTDEIVACAEWMSDVSDVIGSVDQLMNECKVPAAQTKWFWQEVISQLTARRPIEENEVSDWITAAVDEVLQQLDSNGIELEYA